jgi:hypothetical protein
MKCLDPGDVGGARRAQDEVVGRVGLHGVTMQMCNITTIDERSEGFAL